MPRVHNFSSPVGDRGSWSLEPRGLKTRGPRSACRRLRPAWSRPLPVHTHQPYDERYNVLCAQNLLRLRLQLIPKAWLTFEQNLTMVGHLVDLGGREIRLVKAQAARVKKFLAELGDLRTKQNLAKAVRSVGRLSKTIQPRIERHATTNLWNVVMLVTCVEAYLQDVLSAAAGVGPELVRESQQAAAYAEVIAATSLDELANELRTRWARGWLRDGGPTRWISRLEKMGARGYPADLAPRLELIWGIRHAVVHKAGVATADFVQRHPGAVKAAGDRLRVGGRNLSVFVGAVRGFLEPTEKLFLERYPALVAAMPTRPAK